MKNIRFFLSENFQFLEVKFSVYLHRRVFVMDVERTIGKKLMMYKQEKAPYAIRR